MLPGEGAGQEPLVLGGIELAIRLELRALHELRRRAVARGVLDLFVRDLDPAPAVFLPEKHFANQLLVGLICQPVALFQSERAAAVLRLLRLELLRERVPLRGQDVFAVDRRDRGRRRDARSANQPRGVHEQEPTDKGGGDEDPDPFCGGAHSLQQGKLLKDAKQPQKLSAARPYEKCWSPAAFSGSSILN